MFISLQVKENLPEDRCLAWHPLQTSRPSAIATSKPKSRIRGSNLKFSNRKTQCSLGAARWQYFSLFEARYGRISIGETPSHIILTFQRFEWSFGMEKFLSRPVPGCFEYPAFRSSVKIVVSTNL